jgi:hypothetical protein
MESVRDRGTGPGGSRQQVRGDGVRFRNEIVTGVGGKQILAEDPSGNPVELFEPTRPEARMQQPP